jgi:hypothetical protein
MSQTRKLVRFERSLNRMSSGTTAPLAALQEHAGAQLVMSPVQDRPFAQSNYKLIR